MFFFMQNVFNISSSKDAHSYTGYNGQSSFKVDYMISVLIAPFSVRHCKMFWPGTPTAKVFQFFFVGFFYVCFS